MAVIGRAFRINKKDVKSYGYAKPRAGGGGRGMRPNAPGVTAIAAINGPGAYARTRARSARQAMSGLSRNERYARARSLTQRQRNDFAAKVRAKRSGLQQRPTPNKGTKPMQTAAQRRASLRNLRKARAKRGGRARTSARSRRSSRRSHRPNFSAKQRAAALRNLRKARASRKGRKRTAGKRRTHRANKRRGARRTHRRNRRQTAAQRRASLRNLKKARGKRKHRRNAKRRTRRASPKRRHRANKRRTTKRSHRRNRRRSSKRRTHRRNRRTGRRRRQTAAQRRASLRNLKKARGKRRHRKNARRRYGKRRAHRANRRHSKRRSHRRNRRATGHRRITGHKAFRRNAPGSSIVGAMKVGALMLAGFGSAKVLSHLLTDYVLDKIIGQPVTATPAAVSGLEMLQPYKGLISSFVASAVGIVVGNFAIKSVNTKVFVLGGMALSFLHSALVTVLNRFAPTAAGYLSGYGDGTAARLSAMYGLGAGTSIQPMYAPIGMGEYFSEPMDGLGEYFTENLSGLGAYGANPDLYQAAAGFGAMPNTNSNIIDPSSDLDRQLTIAEAAAGVGALPAYEAAAGMGIPSYEASAGLGRFGRRPRFPVSGMGEYFTEQLSGLGAISTVPRADTWVPGMQDPQIWAGVRGITQGQAQNEMVQAGVLNSGGGQGVFG